MTVPQRPADTKTCTEDAPELASSAIRSEQECERADDPRHGGRESAAPDVRAAPMNVQTSGWGRTQNQVTNGAGGIFNNSFNSNFNGMGGGLGWTAKNGFTANIDVSGTNAFNWNQAVEKG